MTTLSAATLLVLDNLQERTALRPGDKVVSTEMSGQLIFIEEVDAVTSIVRLPSGADIYVRTSTLDNAEYL